MELLPFTGDAEAANGLRQMCWLQSEKGSSASVQIREVVLTSTWLAIVMECAPLLSSTPHVPVSDKGTEVIQEPVEASAELFSYPILGDKRWPMPCDLPHGM